MQTIDDRALAALDIRIAAARTSAMAEAAFLAANGPASKNPWNDWGTRLTALLAEREAPSLRMEGQGLSQAVDQLERLDEELKAAEAEREAADHALKEKSEHPTIAKWNAAGSIARRYGYGHTQLLYAAWILSGKARTYAPEGLLFIENEGPAELRFNEQEQKIVREWVKAKDASDKALLKWSNCQDRRQQLLRGWPQLKSASPQRA